MMADTEKKDEELSMEEAFGVIDDIIKSMQEGEASLEETFAMYKRGLKLVEMCTQKIDRVEKDISRIADDLNPEEQAQIKDE